MVLEMSCETDLRALQTQPSVYRHSPAVMDPMASAFTPSSSLCNLSLQVSDAAMSNLYNPEPAVINQSLCLALANEQQAHNETRLALEEESQRCLQLEQQIEMYIQKIARLNTTVNSLGAIIKHNVNKENEAHRNDSNKESTIEADQEGVSLKEFYRNHSLLRKDRESEKTTLGEDVKNVERQYPGGEEENDLTGTAALAETVVDEAQLFNLELLKSPKYDPSPESALRNTLRKHFVITEASVQTTIKTPIKTSADANKLIDLSPESPESPEDSKEIVARENPKIQGTASGQKGWNTLLVSSDVDVNSPLAEKPRYRKPQSLSW